MAGGLHTTCSHFQNALSLPASRPPSSTWMLTCDGGEALEVPGVLPLGVLPPGALAPACLLLMGSCCCCRASNAAASACADGDKDAPAAASRATAAARRCCRIMALAKCTPAMTSVWKETQRICFVIKPHPCSKGGHSSTRMTRRPTCPDSLAQCLTFSTSIAPKERAMKRLSSFSGGMLSAVPLHAAH